MTPKFPADVLVGYSEVGLKGKNRPAFERALASAVRRKVGRRPRRLPGRLVVEDAGGLDEARELAGSVAILPGVAHATPALRCGRTLSEVVEAGSLLLDPSLSFKVKARRQDKSFHLTSRDLAVRLGDHFNGRGHRVDVRHPDQVLGVDVLSDRIYVHAERFAGPGGLPVGSSGVVLALVSGGIDSPVAAHMMMKRGCAVAAAHFYNERAGGHGKVTDLVKVLAKSQGTVPLLAVPFWRVQERIVALVPSRVRMIVNRRFMTRVACAASPLVGAKALVTGDSVGQVASQTLDNLACIRAASDLPVLSPLCGLNKEEIVERAKAVGTYDASCRPYFDCCSYLVHPHPETRANQSDVEAIEAGLEPDVLVSEALDGASWYLVREDGPVEAADSGELRRWRRQFDRFGTKQKP
ncbi:MAG: tRNA 4-thiouridine(8) synthase ThiI [Promethearchaeota archaeon]